MEEKKALQIILTSIYCTDPSLSCNGCPMYEKNTECNNSISNDEFKEAMSFLEEKLKSM